MFTLLIEKLFPVPRKPGLGSHFMTIKKSLLSSPHARVGRSPKSQCADPSLYRVGSSIQKGWEPWLWEKGLWASRRQQYTPVVTIVCHSLPLPPTQSMVIKRDSCTGFHSGDRVGQALQRDKLTTSPRTTEDCTLSPPTGRLRSVCRQRNSPASLAASWRHCSSQNLPRKRERASMGMRIGPVDSRRESVVFI